jgi:hypothetical protein
MSGKGSSNGTVRTGNDQRSDVKNPNNQEHKANQDNRSRNMNPQDAKHTGGKTR